MSSSRNSLSRALLAGAACAAVSAIAPAFVAPATAAEITVFRGSEATVVDTRRTGPLPTVLRGKTASARKGTGEAQSGTVVLYPAIAAGETLWVGRNGRLSACTLRGTGYVGRLRVHCVDR